LVCPFSSALLNLTAMPGSRQSLICSTNFSIFHLLTFIYATFILFFLTQNLFQLINKTGCSPLSEVNSRSTVSKFLTEGLISL
jgi:hypothetical protein